MADAMDAADEGEGLSASQPYLDDLLTALCRLDRLLADAVVVAQAADGKGKDGSQLQALFAATATELEAHADLLAERLVVLGGVALGTARRASTQSPLPEYPGDLAQGHAHALALAERFALYTAAMRGGIVHATDVGDAATAAVYTDISRGVDQRLQVLEAYLHP
jgi:starvation-inducible DNA-binding protein